MFIDTRVDSKLYLLNIKSEKIKFICKIHTFATKIGLQHLVIFFYIFEHAKCTHNKQRLHCSILFWIALEHDEHIDLFFNFRSSFWNLINTWGSKKHSRSFTYTFQTQNHRSPLIPLQLFVGHNTAHQQSSSM